MTNDTRGPEDGPQDATSGWAVPSDPLFDDVLIKSDPLSTGPPMPAMPPAPDPYTAPAPAAAPASEPPPSTWLPRPEPAAVGSPDPMHQAAPQDVAPTPPPYAPRPPLPPAATVSGPRPVSLWSTDPPTPASRTVGRRSARRGRIPVVVIAAVVVLVSGLITVAGVTSSLRSTPTPARSPEPPLGAAVAVAPTGGPVVPVVDPTRIRLEVLAPVGTTATVRYDGDGEDVVRLRDIALPWAVEAPVGAVTSMVSLSATVSSTKPRAERPVTMCRVWLDGILVEESVGRGTAGCYTFLDDFRTTRRDGDEEAALSGVVPVTPGEAAIPVLPPRVSTVTVEADSAVSTKTLVVRFGSAGTANKTELQDQTAPFARRATVPSGVDVISLSAADYDYDYDGERGPTMRCRILVDDVPVETSVSTTSASCSLSLRTTLGS